jgi:hypothetical protein
LLQKKDVTRETGSDGKLFVGSIEFVDGAGVFAGDATSGMFGGAWHRVPKDVSDLDVDPQTSMVNAFACDALIKSRITALNNFDGFCSKNAVDRDTTPNVCSRSYGRAMLC